MRANLDFARTPALGVHGADAPVPLLAEDVDPGLGYGEAHDDVLARHLVRLAALEARRHRLEPQLDL